MADLSPGFIYGLRDMKWTSLDGATQVDANAAQVLSWSEKVVSAELRGDDVIKASVAYPESVEFSIEAGGISLELYAFMTGETVVASGTTPNRTESVVRTGGRNFPYRKIYGRALGDGNDGLHVLLRKAKLTALEGNLGNQEFFITKASGMAIPDASGELYELVINETDTALPAT